MLNKDLIFSCLMPMLKLNLTLNKKLIFCCLMPMSRVKFDLYYQLIYFYLSQRRPTPIRNNLTFFLQKISLDSLFYLKSVRALQDSMMSNLISWPASVQDACSGYPTALCNTYCNGQATLLNITTKDPIQIVNHFQFT